jgi:cytochrome c peroxidase
MRMRTLVTGALAAGIASLGSGARADDALHGATPFARQQQALDGLVKSGPGAPAGIDPSYWASIIPKDNAMTPARIALGRKLYFDPKLSKDGTVACATCHDVARGFTDRRGTSEGINDSLGRRNAPTTLNAALLTSQFWDGRAATLEDQAKLPIINTIEMGQPDGKAAVAAIRGDAMYRQMFDDAYGREINYDDIGRALASFERTLVFVDAPFDKFAQGDAKAISDDARAGWALFNGKGRCVACHQMSGSSPIGSDGRFHNIGVAARTKNFEKLAADALVALAKDERQSTIDELALKTDLSELGRFTTTRHRADIGAFKTEQVRNVGITAPYMHDGSMQTLWDVVDHYNKGGEVNAYLDGGIEPLDLSDKEEDQLVAFLFTLTDERFAKENAAEYARQKKIAATRRPLRDRALASRKVFLFEQRLAGRIGHPDTQGNKVAPGKDSNPKEQR